jgi:hypothetical protein
MASGLVGRREPGIAGVMGELGRACSRASKTLRLRRSLYCIKAIGAIVEGSAPPPRTPSPLDERTLVGGVVVLLEASRGARRMAMPRALEHSRIPVQKKKKEACPSQSPPRAVDIRDWRAGTPVSREGWPDGDFRGLSKTSQLGALRALPRQGPWCMLVLDGNGNIANSPGLECPCPATAKQPSPVLWVRMPKSCLLVLLSSSKTCQRRPVSPMIAKQQATGRATSTQLPGLGVADMAI